MKNKPFHEKVFHGANGLAPLPQYPRLIDKDPDDMPTQTFATGYTHDKWIRDGNCPVISITKSWCSKKVNHDGLHYSPRIPDPDRPIGEGNHAYVEWER